MTLKAQRYQCKYQGNDGSLPIYAAICVKKRSGITQTKRAIGRFAGISDGLPVYTFANCEFPQIGRYLMHYVGMDDLPVYALTCCSDSSSGSGEFGVQVDAISTEDLRTILHEEGIGDIDLMKLDCEGAEYAILPELARLGAMKSIGWIRGEWHYRKQNPILASALVRTHAYNIDVNLPHEVGLFIAHRL